jgi:hypothetical protein
MKKEHQEQFIIEYLLKHTCTSVCDVLFHEQYHERFGGKQKEYYYGASPVYKAQRLLASMWKRGLLNRHRVSIPEMQIDIPNWVYVYELHPELKIGLSSDIINLKDKS